MKNKYIHTTYDMVNNRTLVYEAKKICNYLINKANLTKLLKPITNYDTSTPILFKLKLIQFEEHIYLILDKFR